MHRVRDEDDAHHGDQSARHVPKRHLSCPELKRQVVVRPIAIGRMNWLSVRSLRAGKRAAAVMRPIRMAKLNGLDPYGSLKDVLTRLPTQRASQIGQLLPRERPAVPS